VLFRSAGSAWLFLAGQKEDLNLRAAFMHLASDALVSLGTVATGLVILATGWAWLDPLISLGIAVIILLGTWGLLVEALDLALDAVPRHIQPEEVQSYLATLPGVAEVHDLHIWGMSTTEVALTAHLLMPEGTEDAFLVQVQQQLLHDFGIQHTTLQVETGALSCERCILQR